jgi:hypothetical protein
VCNCPTPNGKWFQETAATQDSFTAVDVIVGVNMHYIHRKMLGQKHGSQFHLHFHE